MALDSKSSSGFIPCYYFNILADRGIESFENAFFNPVKIEYAMSDAEKNYIKNEIVPDKIEDIKTISQSDLKNYYLCPKKYEYSKLTGSEEKTFFTKGNLLHAFAEFYFHYPDEASENIDRILEEMIKQYKVFFKEGNMAAERTEFAVGMKAIMKFIDSKLFVKDKREDTVEGKDNFLFAMFGKERIYSNTELKFVNLKSGINGKIDLISGKTIVDYKTGRQNKTDATLIKEFKPHLLTETSIKDVNFQTPAYISGQRDNFEKEEIEFIYLHLMESRDKILKGNEFEIDYSFLKYIPMTFKEYVLSEGCFKTLNSDFFVRVGYQNYKRIVEEKFELIDFYDLNSIFKELEDDFCTFGFQELKITLKEFKKASEETFRRDIIQKSLKQLSSVRTDVRKYPFIFEDDIDSFNELVKKMIDEINDNSKSDFPNMPALGLRNICRDCDYLNICINNKFWTGVEIEDY
ncbi:MAG: PD-(D/E)XK nuclease family protein [Ignavibacteria bacterium]|nr:PD-(D/E)XK nuclease family protein [Ignavibacteria bacterium]